MYFPCLMTESIFLFIKFPSLIPFEFLVFLCLAKSIKFIFFWLILFGKNGIFNLNKMFIENAPQAVVDNEMKKLDDVKSKIKILEKKMSQLK